MTVRSRTKPKPLERPVQDAGRVERRTAGFRWRFVVASIFFLLVALAARHWRTEDVTPELQPFDGPLVKEVSEFDVDYKGRLLWGTYRPGYYLGMRMRVPQSLLFGIMWFDPSREDAWSNIRHEAREPDGLKYGWRAHDGHSFGNQQIVDGETIITTTMVKKWCPTCGYGGDWAVRISAKNQGQETPPGRISLIFYVADEQVQNRMDALAKATGGSTQKVASGPFCTNAAWTLHASEERGRLSKLRQASIASPHFHNLTQLVQSTMKFSYRGKGAEKRPSLVLRNHSDPMANIAVFQLTAALPITLDLAFTTTVAPEDPGGHSRIPGSEEHYANMQDGTEGTGDRVSALVGKRLTQLVEERQQAFDKRFAVAFPDTLASGTPQGTGPVAKAALSNLLGGMGYFYGSSDVRVGSQVRQNWPAPLFTAVPSRSFFPRGFLWDEGFHQLLIRKWDPAISRDILAHWLDLVNSQGWIAREQILGAEARARVPAEFVVQYPDVANPPTLFFVLADMASGISQPGGGSREDHEFLTAAYPRLCAWFEWLNRTQAGPVAGSYRWRGRDAATDRELNPKTLSSGFDDYPRASHPSSEERHVDLRCWMALAAHTLLRVARALGLAGEQIQRYEATAALLGDVEGLNRLHLDPASGLYRDFGNHTEDVALRWQLVRLPDGTPVGRELKRVVLGQPPRPQLVPHSGYVSLFPFVMRLIPPGSSPLEAQLQLIRSTDQLSTPFGLRSLAASSSIYDQYNTEHDPPYWRGAVWLNMNYLTLAALDHYGRGAGEMAGRARELHDELRHGLLTNVVRQYNNSGFLWENYDDKAGTGRGSHPFTGWTALIVLIAGQSYFPM